MLITNWFTGSQFVFTFDSAFHVRRSRSNLNTNREPSTWKRERHLSLPLLVLGVGADHADDSAPPHNLALVANLFYRRSYLHIGLQLSHDPPACQIPRRQLYFHAVANEEPDEIPPDTAADVRRNLPRAVEFHLIQTARQLRRDDPRNRPFAHSWRRTVSGPRRPG